MYYKIRLRIVILILPPNKNSKTGFGNNLSLSIVLHQNYCILKIGK